MREITKPTATQSMLLAMVMAICISWADGAINDDYGMATMYVVCIIIARWFGTPWSALAVGVFCTSSEVYTNVRTGAYNESFRQGHTWVPLSGILMHMIEYGAVSSTIGYILRLLKREKGAVKSAEAANEALLDVLKNVRELESLLPICSYCKKIRDESGQWEKIEMYIADRTKTNFTHGCCPDCKDREMKAFYEQAGPPVPPGGRPDFVKPHTP